MGTSSYYVEQGTVRIAHSGVEQIVHAGEQWSAPVDGDWGLENVGDDVARIVEVDVNDAIATSSVDASTNSKFSDPQGYADSFVIKRATDLATGSGGVTRVTLERLTLPPGTALDPYTKTQFDWIGIAAGRVGVTLEGERLPFRWDPGEERTFGLYQTLPPIQPGTEMTLRNAGDDPSSLPPDDRTEWGGSGQRPRHHKHEVVSGHRTRNAGETQFPAFLAYTGRGHGICRSLTGTGKSTMLGRPKPRRLNEPIAVSLEEYCSPGSLLPALGDQTQPLVGP